MKILVCIPIKPTINVVLREKCTALATSLAAANSAHHIGVFFDFSPIPKQATDSRAWSKVARARNQLLDRITITAWDYLLWIDADVVEYPLDLPTRLIEGNPDGVSAPMVMVEDSNRFYDYAAFVMSGKDVLFPNELGRLYGRNLQHEPPYWNEMAGKDLTLEQRTNVAKPIWFQPKTDIVDMDCVGTITMVPTWVYQHARYEDHPAFTDHYPICKACRDHGKRVTVDRRLIAVHADLPKYGEQWH